MRTILPVCVICMGLALESRSAEPAGPLEWLEWNQDTASPERDLLADTIGGESAQTFNNSLAAMAFLIEGRADRARRILDFYAAAMERDNPDNLRQNFYVNGEARGFYQNAAIRNTATNRRGEAIWNGDRWMGDNAWLYFACALHDRLHRGERYAALRAALVALLESWFIPVGDGGYVGSGWRAFDSMLHESDGHEEGNLDAYAVFRMAGRSERAAEVRLWLLPRLEGPERPLDHLTWRVLAGLGGDPDWIERTPGYRKTRTHQGVEVTGYSAFPKPEAPIWTEGIAHMAAAYYALGRMDDGDRCLREMEKLFIAVAAPEGFVSALPYTDEAGPGYEWVNPEEGFTSSCAWYLIARHRFNPMRVAARDLTSSENLNTRN